MLQNPKHGAEMLLEVFPNIFLAVDACWTAYPPVIRRGLLENPAFIDIYRRFFH